MSNIDTTISEFKCYFQKLPGDTIYSSAFHYQYQSNEEYIRDVLYTGNEYVSYSTEDSSGRVMSKTLWANEIKSSSNNSAFYSPLTSKNSYPLPSDSSYIDHDQIFEFIREESINNIPCYHVRMNIIPKNDSSEIMKTLRVENNYWISKQDYLPIQYSIAYDMVINNDTMYQFEKNILTNHKLNIQNNTAQLELSSIPTFINLQDYIPQKSSKLLKNNTIAPNWSLNSLADTIISLSDFKGKIVLIDFFYKSCYPCVLSLPVLQNLHEKYKDKGLKVIGINPYDSKEKDDMCNFLSKHGVTYTVLLAGKGVAKEYHVSAYPTIYLIDKEGVIISTHVGYGEETREELEIIIEQNL